MAYIKQQNDVVFEIPPNNVSVKTEILENKQQKDGRGGEGKGGKGREWKGREEKGGGRKRGGREEEEKKKENLS